MNRKFLVTGVVLIFVVIIVIIVFQFNNSNPDTRLNYEFKKENCDSDSDCIPCGTECISWKETSTFNCKSLGLKCACVNNTCQKNNTCSTDYDCGYLNIQNQKPPRYGLCLNGVCVQSCSSSEYILGCR